MEKYELIEYLGEGSFGVAHLCRDNQTQELVAIKFIERGPMIDENVEREIINHRLLQHPNIIRFKEAILTSRYLALVMEYAFGGELFQRISKFGPCTEDEARYFFRQLIYGVDYIHTENICHRDLKLDNILLDGRKPPCLKICDFGYSKDLNGTSHRGYLKRRIIGDILGRKSTHVKQFDFGNSKQICNKKLIVEGTRSNRNPTSQSMLLSKPYTIVGSATYTAPEVLDGYGHDGKMADVWSCGVTLYVMLVAAYPFEDSNCSGNSKKPNKRISSGGYEIPDHLNISKECQHLLSSIFVQNPLKRISIKGIMSHPWFSKNLEVEETKQKQKVIHKKGNPKLVNQSVEEIMNIVMEARKPPIIDNHHGQRGEEDEEDDFVY